MELMGVFYAFGGLLKLDKTLAHMMVSFLRSDHQFSTSGWWKDAYKERCATFIAPNPEIL
jgi:hypothetical protein